MYLHDNLKLVYLANPRTGSQATATALMKVGFHHVSPIAHSPRQTHHTKLYSLHCPIPDDDIKEWTAITTVRNHWDCVVSWMATPPAPGKKWKAEELENRLKAPRYISDHSLFLHLPDAQIVWRFESLQDDMDKTLPNYGLECPKLEWENWTEWRKGTHYRDFYSERTRDYIATRFADEITQLGYSF